MFNGQCNNCGKAIAHDTNKSIKVGGSYWVTTSGTWYCSNKCKDEREGTNSNQSNQSGGGSGNEEKKSGGGFLSGLTGGGDSASKIAQTQLLGSLLADSMNENKDIRAKVDEVSKMIFSTDANELANQMNELLTIGAGTASEHKELIKACYEKMDFGVMKLKSIGANAEAVFFEGKRNSIKPKGMFGF
jgi:hypothetical protein